MLDEEIRRPSKDNTNQNRRCDNYVYYYKKEQGCLLIKLKIKTVHLNGLRTLF